MITTNKDGMGKIKTLDDLFDRVRAALDSIQPVIWTKRKNSWKGKFQIDNVFYEIIFKNYSKNGEHFLYELKRNESDSVAEKIIKQLSSVPTVEMAITEFINEREPETLMCITNKASKVASKNLNKFHSKFKNKFKYQNSEKRMDPLYFYILTKEYSEELERSINKIVKEKIEEEQAKEELDYYFMTTVSVEDSGLPMMVWISIEGNGNYGPCIWAQRTYIHRMTPRDLFAVSISDNPEIKNSNKGKIKASDLQKLFSWVKLNKKNLLKLWNIEFNTIGDCVRVLKKIKY